MFKIANPTALPHLFCAEIEEQELAQAMLMQPGLRTNVSASGGEPGHLASNGK